MKKILFTVVAVFSFTTVMFMGADEAHAYVQTESAGMKGVIYAKKPLEFTVAGLDNATKVNQQIGFKVNGVNEPLATVKKRSIESKSSGLYVVTFIVSYKGGVFYNELPVKIIDSPVENAKNLLNAKNKALDGIQDLYNNGFISYKVFYDNHMAIKNAKTISSVNSIYNRLYNSVINK